MKKILVLTMMLAMAVLLTSCGPKVKMEEAKKIAVTAAGQDINSVEFTLERQNTENGVTKYEFVFHNDTGEWSYTLDGDGNITGAKEQLNEKETEAPKAEAAPAETAAASDAAGNEVPELQLAKPGSEAENPAFDPYNGYENYGVDQEAILKALKENGFVTVVEKENSDLYVYSSGLNKSCTNSDVSYIVIGTEKGKYTPTLIRYLNRYNSHPDQFAEDFKTLAAKLEEKYGRETAAGFEYSDGEITSGTAQNCVDTILNLQKTNGGFMFIKYDSGSPSVSLNAEYDADQDMYSIYLDFE